MPDRPVLPRIYSFELHGFAPIFSEQVKITLSEGPFVILGGNGLGKTTLAQAIIYGLAGGFSSDDLEAIKSFRWNHGYFRGRLKGVQLSDAYIEVGFQFNERLFSVRRGFRGSDVIAFRTGVEPWETNETVARAAFQSALVQHGGYRHENDFAFIVHRLLYLPESRRLLAWDTEAQVRILLLLNQDVTPEDQFRMRRKDLKAMDSRKRHTRVAINKADDSLARLLEESSDDEDAEAPVESEPPSAESLEVLRMKVDRLHSLVKRNTSLKNETDLVGDELTKTSDQIDHLRSQIEVAEAALVSQFLQDEEKERGLAVHKMIENGICPVCGIMQAHLRDSAHRHWVKHECALCGSDQPHETNPELDTIRSRLTEKLRAKRALEADFRQLSTQLSFSQKEESQLQRELNEARFSRPVVIVRNNELAQPTKDWLLAEKQRLLEEETELEIQISSLSAELNAEYARYRERTDVKIHRLKDLFSGYATKFLGHECALAEVEQKGHSTVSVFVPEFNGVVRESPDACSEAQRFFLDIALRMALIDMASSEYGEFATFVCETPETALDISYVNNVVQMMREFCQKGNSLLLTANIQSNGIAGKLLYTIPVSERESHLLNLLKLGILSDVQTRELSILEGCVNQILTTTDSK